MTRASTSGARVPNNLRLRSVMRSRNAPRPRGSASSSCMRRATSTPRLESPRNRPATTHVVPPCAAWPSGQRIVSVPRHAPPIACASTTPPARDTGSARRTMAARVTPTRRLGSPPRAPHRPTQDPCRSRSAAEPHSSPATSMTPRAAPSGARRCSTAAPNNTNTAATCSSPPVSARTNPAPKAMVR